MEGRVKILETYRKSEEIISFYPKFSSICRPISTGYYHILWNTTMTSPDLCDQRLSLFTVHSILNTVDFVSNQSCKIHIT